MASYNLDAKQKERRFKKIIPKLLEDIDAMSADYGVEVCVITKCPWDTRPTIWASPAMTRELFEPREAEMDRLLKMKRKLEEASVKIKQMLAEKKRKNSLSDGSVLSPPQGNGGGSSSEGGNI